MLKRLNRDYKQSFEAVDAEFPGCHYIMLLDDIHDMEGFLLAVSEEPDTNSELCSIRLEYPVGTPMHIGGIYKNAAAIGVQSIIE